MCEQNKLYSTSLNYKHHIPEFLAKTTLYCSVIGLLFMIALIIQNWFKFNTLLISASLLIAIFAITNISYGIRNKYNLFLNTFIFMPFTCLTFLLLVHQFGAAASYWSFMLVLSCYFVLPISRAVLFNLLILMVSIPYVSTFLDQASSFKFSFALFGTSLFAYSGMHEIDKLHAILKAQATIDTLTGLYNRTLLEDSLTQSIAQYHRTGLPMTLVSLDIDHFKKINDNLGHDIGDVVLKRLGELLRSRIRSSDRAFRIGGEEFLIILHNTSKHRAEQIAEELRQQIQMYEFIPLQKITMSFGVAEIEKEMDSTQWLKQADVKLYKAKEIGRNCVVI